MDSLDEDLLALAEGIGPALNEACDRRSVHDFFDGKNDLDKTLWAMAAELGWLGIGLPEECGGLGMGARGLDVLYRALGSVAAPGGFAATLASAQWLAEFGPDEVREGLLPEVVAGAKTIAAPAVLDGRAPVLDRGCVTGRSLLMLSPRDADLALVPVDEGGAAAIALVELGGSADSFTEAGGWDTTRQTGHFTFDRARAVAVVRDQGGPALSGLRRNLALAIAGDCAGGARAIAEQTIDYLKDRSQFGRTLASMQALKHRAADLMTEAFRIDALLEQAVLVVAQGEPSADMWAMLAKASAGERFKEVAEDCVQLYGGVGFTWEFDCHIFLKRALLNREVAGNAGRLRDLAHGQFRDAALSGTTTAELSL